MFLLNQQSIHCYKPKLCPYETSRAYKPKVCSWYQPRPRILLAALEGPATPGTAPGQAEMKVYIFICCKVLHPMHFTKQSQVQIYSINIFGGKMSLSKTEECFLNSRSYDSWNQGVISLELKESMLMYIHAVVLCTQAIYTSSRMHTYLSQSTQMTPEITWQS